MKRILVVSICVFVLFSFESCYKEVIIFDSEPNNFLELELILRINNKDCSFDKNSNTLRYPIEGNSINNFEAFIEFQDYSKIYFNDLLLNNNSANNLGDIEINKDYNLLVITQEITHKLKIQFTNLPIIQIITHNYIVDEPKTLARLIINYPSTIENKITSYIGLEYRGETSQAYPKKSFYFCFLNSIRTNDRISRSIFDLPKNSDWWLDAMYVDESRLRNKTSFDIWRQIEGDRNYGINSYFVELYINSDHQGLYCINENVNAEFLNMFSYDAVLYKAISWDGTRFEVYSENVSINKYWDGWEQKFPDSKDRINWGPLLHLRDLVVNHSDNDFISQINELINLDNFIDYYIFLNLISALDNTGKNLFLARKSQEDPLFIIPLDLEGSFGLTWNGDYVHYTQILSNNLYERLFELDPNNFKTKLKDKWFSLRNEVLSTDNLLEIFNFNFNNLHESNVLQIEHNTWNVNINISAEESFINTWLINRTTFLDKYYANL